MLFAPAGVDINSSNLEPTKVLQRCQNIYLCSKNAAENQVNYVEQNVVFNNIFLDMRNKTCTKLFTQASRIRGLIVEQNGRKFGLIGQVSRICGPFFCFVVLLLRDVWCFYAFGGYSVQYSEDCILQEAKGLDPLLDLFAFL